ncbi:unnamed protein product [Dovyalis caffra]|uniref:Uncharacterized protein n=1 Tax=Dovyalis caffra TaxID=77055 RepID=A0AAV1RNS4_9ROSI|nr:unnamed protein product [Dovyalis caffra]
MAVLSSCLGSPYFGEPSGPRYKKPFTIFRKATVLRGCRGHGVMMQERTLMTVKEISGGSQGVLQKQHPYWLLLSSAIQTVPRQIVTEPAAKRAARNNDVSTADPQKQASKEGASLMIVASPGRTASRYQVQRDLRLIIHDLKWDPCSNKIGLAQLAVAGFT